MPIKKLSQDVASKIAAGEVVERPLSVVKELLENAIDAQASEIEILIENAGQRLIQVMDNGVGIPIAETEIAIQRYATSKLTSLEDLESIQTLGFRGEALASIASVARLSLATRAVGEEMGSLTRVEGGQVMERSAAGLNSGTRVMVEDLFFNVPARRKFLKAENTERHAIAELVSRYALYYSAIRIKLLVEGRQLLLTNGNDDRREILAQIYDVSIARNLLDLKVTDEYLGVEGFISPLTLTRSNRKEIFFFLNGRGISDASLGAAVTQAYHNLLMVGRFPLAAIFLKIDPREVDVNVHPTKAEVRFRESRRIFSLLHSAVRKSISTLADIPTVSPSIWTGWKSENRSIDPAWSMAAKSDSKNFGMGSEQTPVHSLEGSRPMSETPLVKVPLLRLIGQIGRTYLVAEGPDGLYLIDQHAAHERVLFEKFLNKTLPPGSQYLLEPIVVQIPERLEGDFQTQLDLMTRIGFSIENFGPAAYRIQAVPQIISQLDPTEAFLSALEEDDEDATLVEQEKDKQLIARICKRAAVKGGQVLSIDEQERLVRDLEQCESPRTCPHGRPTMIHLSVDMLERQFGRRGSR